MREIQIKTTMRYPFTLTRIALIKNKQKTASVSKDMKLELLYTVDGTTKRLSHCKKKNLMVLQKVKTENYHTTHSQVYIQNWKQIIKYLTHTFIAALFTIVKMWRQPKCPSKYKWINKFWYIQRMEYYSVMERNEELIHTTMWMNSQDTVPKRGQIENVSYFISPFIWNIQHR